MTGSELAALRESAGLSQDDLAERIGLAGKYRGQSISRLETGQRAISPRYERMFRLLFESLTAAK